MSDILTAPELAGLVGCEASVDKIFTSASWAEAQDKHRRVADKAMRVLPRTAK